MWAESGEAVWQFLFTLLSSSLSFNLFLDVSHPVSVQKNRLPALTPLKAP